MGLGGYVMVDWSLRECFRQLAFAGLAVFLAELDSLAQACLSELAVLVVSRISTHSF